MFEFKVGSAVVQLIVGDITDMEVDVVVNAANSTLLGGLGVDGAIHSKGGCEILEECKKIRSTIWPDGLPTGYAVITLGGNLRAKWVIHTVGPVWHGGLQGEAELLKQAYRNSLKLAVAKGLKTVAFPSISTGAYRYPAEEASQVAFRVMKNFLEKEQSVEKVVMVLYTEQLFEVYLTAAKQIF
ncbi:MAG: O-acetyl-ADP-ribose deacetylase [Candidatus Bathyarchaeota archaeon]|nr:O-acetyl-ADP-ribose deacetylase [Candidatus Termiticorpusculum sp.]